MSLKPSIKYYNLTNSAWEPLLEPYQFMLRVARSEAGGEAGKMAVSFTSKERLELNVTAAFIELAITSYTQWTSESDRILNNARGGDAPYSVRNRTGYPIEIWPDGRASKTKTKIEDGADVAWRFEDYKTLREVSQPSCVDGNSSKLTNRFPHLAFFSTSANSASTL